MMNIYREELLSRVKQVALSSVKPFHDGQSYCGTRDFFYDLTTEQKRAIAKEFRKLYPELNFQDFIKLLTSLNESGSYEEKTIGSTLLQLYPDHLSKITPQHVEKWLKNLEGWAEIDSLCQSTFGADQLLRVWRDWENALRKFARSPHVSLRRASIVLLTKAVSQTRDDRLLQLSLQNIELLKSEKDILITKAVSWLLRSMVKQYKSEVTDYLREHEATLPAIAARETRRKIETGKK